MDNIDILRVSNLPPFLMSDLQAAYMVHDNAHIADPGALTRVRAIVGGGESKVDGKLLALFPNVEIISVFGVGYDGVDVAAAKARNIMVTHTPNVLNDDVADLAMGLMLSAARQLPAADRSVKEGQWPQGPMPLARKVSGARLGIVGIGRIGQAIAQRAKAFNMSIAYTARSQRAELPYAYYPNPTELPRCLTIWWSSRRAAQTPAS